MATEQLEDCPMLARWRLVDETDEPTPKTTAHTDVTYDRQRGLDGVEHVA